MLESVQVPVAPVVRFLLALSVQGPARQPVKEHAGWAWYRWEGMGGKGEVGVRTPDHRDHAPEDDLASWVVTTAPTRCRSYSELAAILTRLVEFDGAEGKWRLERVAELLYGPARPSSHRERQLPPLHAWLALLQRGRWKLGSGPARPLLTVERDSRRSAATVHLEPQLAQALGAPRVEVPAQTFLIPQPGHHNPEGNLPSLAVRARARLAAVFAYCWRKRPDEDPLLEDILVGCGGLDVGPVTRRRRLNDWLDQLGEDLVHTATKLLGVGLAACPPPARQVLRTALRLVKANGPKRSAPLRAPSPARAPP